MIPSLNTKPCTDSSSITELVGALCNCCLSGVSWKRRALGGISRENFHKTLKKHAYGALLSKLFQDSIKGSSAPKPNLTANSTPSRNKVLMICFDLRVAGCREEAERLEELLGILLEGSASGLKEVDAVLELFVQLAGSTPPPATTFNQDYMRRERPVVRKPQPWSYQSEELQRLEARAWGLICAEEWGALETLCGTQSLMDAPPGTGLLTLRSKTESEERFEKETRLSLFGALQHARTSDLDIRLDLPPVPSNIDVIGLAIKVPPSLDQSEDEGFQSASNLTPESQSESTPGPELDLWEAALMFEPGRRRCWESVGCPPGNREALFITESGREAFDHLYRVWEGGLRVLSGDTPSPLLPLPQDTQTQLVTDLLNVLIGVASTTFPLNQSVQFDVRPGVCVSGASPESVSRLLQELAQYGTHYLRLSHFSLQSADKKGLVFQAFTGGLRKYLHYYRACVLSTPPTLSLLTIGFLFRKVGHQLRYLSELCCVDGPLGAGQATFPVGVKLLSYLYNEAQNNCSNENYPVLLSLLKRSCAPYTRFVSDWVYSGVFRDVYGEFMIQVNEEYLGFRDKNYWVQGYTLISKDVEDCVPIFLRHIANDVYVCGKTINLLKICCPQHYICWSELPAPRIAVTFSLQEVEEIEKECAVYRGRMECIAKHSAISREELVLRAERARQELINQVRESAAKTLENIRGRQVSQRLAEEAKKRERFEELQLHLEQEQEWRIAANNKQEEDDFSFARELRDREKRLQALEQQLEQQARKELITQYSRLSEEAALRERRALWRVQRMRLHEARMQFLTQDEQQIQDLVKKYPRGQGRPPIDLFPPLHSAQPAIPQSAQKFPKEVHPEEHEKQHEETQEYAPTPQTEMQPYPDPTTPSMDPNLIFESIDINYFLPKAPNPDSAEVDSALQDIGSNLPQTCPTFPLVDYDFSSPFSPLEGMTSQVQPKFKSDSGTEPGPDKNHESFSHIPLGENVSSMQDICPKASPFGQDTKPSFRLGQFTPQDSPKSEISGDKPHDLIDINFSMSEPKQEDGSLASEITFTGSKLPPTSPSAQEETLEMDNLKDASSTEESTDKVLINLPESQNFCSDSKIAEFTSNIDAILPSITYRHSCDSQIEIVENVSDITAPLPSPYILGHASDSNIKLGDLVSDIAPSLPSQNVLGHSSDSHIKIGENVSDFVAPLPTANIHGHSSYANIKIGEFVSDVTQARPRWSKHGHASDSMLQPGCTILGSEPTLSPLPGSTFGHSSDSTLGAGCVVAGIKPKKSPLLGSAHGHSSDSSLGVGCVVSQPETMLSPLPGSTFGHSSDSALGIGCIVAGVEPRKPPLPGSTYGHSSDSSLGVGCVVSTSGPVQSPLSRSAFGHSSDSSLGVGCVVKSKERGGDQASRDKETEVSLSGWAGEQEARWGASGWALSPQDMSEQQYLSALSSQYQAEHYEDCYNAMASSPECQLLKPITHGPWAVHTAQALHMAPDSSSLQLSEMVSLPVLIKHSVTAPLITHVSLVNKAVVDFFFVELGVERHFEALRHFLLMEDGEFAQSLSDLLFEKVGSGQTPGELLTPLVLNSILHKALQYSLHGDTPLARNFTFALRYLPETFHPHAPDSLNCLELRYRVDWPLNIIITDSCMNKYNRLFSFLLQLKHMVWSLRDVWFHLRRTALVKGAGRSVQFRQLQLYRHEMQHFVKVIQGYIANQILQVSWSEFITKLTSANDLDAIHRTHADYLNRAIFRGLLTDKAAPVMNIIHSIFSLILKFRAQLIALPWENQQGEAVHPSFIAMQQSYNTFKYYSHFLFKVVTKLVNRGYQPHLEDFLLRINFNSYYKDS
ncbi:gamma-tubulin complex component 6 isoform X2 [Boleophthalmus pectinirostris]|uniref:gamma-tubulin complex component 6 isoform X2 n=1 Tax=Boleophthalmus pectinirostris TaxID=150288 RepID=UPI00242B55E3|nr:gamma-tubulin complex component 6 isoform X2 [Boleophthalmus pectinirostris]